MQIIQFVQAHPYFSIATTLSIGSFIKIFDDYIQGAIAAFIGLFWVKKYALDNYTNCVIYDYLNAKYGGWGISDEVYEAKWEHIRPLEEESNTWYRNKSYSARLWFYKGRPILTLPPHTQKNFQHQAFFFFRWTINWNKLIKEAGEYRDSTLRLAKLNNENKFQITRHTGNGSKKVFSNDNKKSGAPMAYGEEGNKGYSFHKEGELLFWKDEDVGNPQPDDPIGYLSVNDSMAEVIERVKFWYNDQAWYKERGIDWKLGVLLYGKPGSGKTSLLRALAQELKIPMHIFDLPTLNAYDFIEAWQVAQNDKPRMVVFEDWDTVFHGRKNIIPNSDLDLGTILNLIDGVEREHGLLTFITTNNVEHIDEAVGAPTKEDPKISTRPGRIDMCQKLEPLDKEGRIKMANRILKGFPEAAEEMVRLYNRAGAVQFQDRCIRKALELHLQKDVVKNAAA